MSRQVIYFFFVLSFVSCTRQNNKINEAVKNSQTNKDSTLIISDNGKSDLVVVLFESKNGFGYSIYQNNTILIKQSTIPGTTGYQGFINKEDALLVAQLVSNKIIKGKFPPSVSLHELDSLAITY
jgi:hypothetical protein